MKHSAFFHALVFLFLLASFEAASQVIKVKRYSDFNIGYLTIIQNGVIIINEPKNVEYSMILEYFPVADSTGSIHGPMSPEIGSAVLEVNGIDARGMTEQEFYDRLREKGKTFSLKLRRCNSDIIEEGIWKFEALPIVFLRQWIPINDRYDSYPRYSSNIGMLDFVMDNRGQTLKEQGNSIFSDAKVKSEEISVPNYDFARCKTYDYVITGGDNLNDPKILDRISKPWNMTRDENNPDILFAIAKNSQESVSSTYVPPSSRTENLGSITSMHYGPLTQKAYFTTRQFNRTVTEGGFTHTDVSTSLFLELSAIDVKKMDDPSIQYVPLIWKKTIRHNLLNSNTPVNEAMGNYASWSAMPPFDRFVQVDRRVCADASGIVNDGNIIRRVIPESRADKAGFKNNDLLVSAVATRIYYKADKSFYPYYTSGKRVRKKITVKNFTKGFFDDACNVRREANEWNGFEKDCWLGTARAEWANWERDSEKKYLSQPHDGPWCIHEGTPWHHWMQGGDYNIWLDWEVTVKRDGKKIKLILPGSRKGITVSYSYMK